MAEALEEARLAAEKGEVPIGAVVVRDNRIIARSHNEREASGDPLGHAEMVALRLAGEALGRWRLDGTTLYVTLEPCPMCAGAIMQSRVSTVVYGTPDPRAGCCGSLYNLIEDRRFPTRCKVVSGVLGAECARILQDFFLVRRKG